MDTTKTIIAVVAIAVIVILVYMFATGQADDSVETVTTNINQTLDDIATTTDDDAPDVTWQTYENDAFDFTFNYPAQASTSIEQGRVNVTYLGPNNTPNSEISDGYTFSVMTQSATSTDPDATSLQEAAEAYFEDQTAILTSVASPTNRMIGVTPAYTFAVESQLGPTMEYVMWEAEDGVVYVANYMVMDPQNRGYEDTIDDMLNSFEYTGD